MLVKDVAKQKGITFEQVNQCFLEDYSTEDAQRFWESDWDSVQTTWMYYSPICNLFWNGYHSRG